MSRFRNLSEIIAASKGLRSDSRQVGKDEIFVALKGEKSNGHDHVEDVLQRGAVAAVVSLDAMKAKAGWAGDSRIFPVADTHAAHRELAGLWRKRFQGKVVAIGGSNGKTSTKEFLAAILATKFRVAKTDKSQNGELGVPKTLEKLGPNVDVAVIEVGIDGPGDMVRHAALVAPDFALLTSIGEEHLNLLKSVENVFREEVILFDKTWEHGGECFAPESDPYLARLRGRPRLVLTPGEPTKIKTSFATKLGHPKAKQNAALAAAVALKLGMSEREVATALLTLKPADSRGAEVALPGGGTLLADHYNSNPSSLRASLEYLQSRAKELGKPVALIVGDMFDLGDSTRSAHESFVDAFVASDPTHLFLVGVEMSRLAPALSRRLPKAKVETWADSNAVAERAASVLSVYPGLVLLKGSRGMAMERAAAAYL